MPAMRLPLAAAPVPPWPSIFAWQPARSATWRSTRVHAVSFARCVLLFLTRPLISESSADADPEVDDRAARRVAADRVGRIGLLHGGAAQDVELAREVERHRRVRERGRELLL